jgi:hypothetical protein
MQTTRVVIRSQGGPEVMELETIDLPPPVRASYRLNRRLWA